MNTTQENKLKPTFLTLRVFDPGQPNNIDETLKAELTIDGKRIEIEDQLHLATLWIDAMKIALAKNGML